MNFNSNSTIPTISCPSKLANKLNATSNTLRPLKSLPQQRSRFLPPRMVRSDSREDLSYSSSAGVMVIKRAQLSNPLRLRGFSSDACIQQLSDEVALYCSNDDENEDTSMTEKSLPHLSKQLKRCISLPIVHSKDLNVISLKQSFIKTDPPFLTLSLRDMIAKKMWKEVIELSILKPNETLTEITMNLRGYTSQCLPIHWAIVCQAPNSVILALIKASSSKCLMKSESVNHFLPIHLACSRGGCVELIETLIQFCPDALEIKDKDGNLPLHIASLRCTCAVVKEILYAHKDLKEAATKQNQKKQIPLLLSVSRYDASLEIVKTLLRADPTGATIQDLYGHTSLHLAVMWRVPHAILKILLTISPSSARLKDLSNRTPYFIARRICRYPKDNPIVLDLVKAMMIKSNLLCKVGIWIDQMPVSMKYKRSRPRPIHGSEIPFRSY